MPGKYHMRGAGDILYIDEIFHEIYFIVLFFKMRYKLWLVIGLKLD